MLMAGHLDFIIYKLFCGLIYHLTALLPVTALGPE